ncbi:MAG: hypothetical protein ACOX8H_00265 [Ruminococcus sp.]|jgi:hypothetical protein
MDLKNIKKILKKVFFLPPGVTLLVAVPSFVLVFWVLASEPANPFLTYTSYVFSAYGAVITGTGMPGLIHWFREGIRNNLLVRKLLKIPVIRRCLDEHVYRTKISLYPSLVINFLYAGLKLFSGIRYRSVWFGTLAVYYILLAVMRFFLLNYLRRKDGNTGENQREELKRCRMCGIVLGVLDWALAGIIILVVTKDSGFTYPGILIYLMALYTFYAVITAVMNVIRFRKYGSPVISAAKVISLTAALVSMLSLETAMLTRFGGTEDIALQKGMVTATGTAVTAVVFVMAGYMVLRTTMEINKLKNSGGRNR